MCCKLLHIGEADSNAGDWCKQCDPGRGCKIHGDHPADCKTYQCAWSQMDDVDMEMRPDKSKIIFDKVNDHLFTAMQHPDYEVKDIVVGQINQFLKDGFSVVVFYPKAEKKPIMALAKGHLSTDIWKEIQDRTKELTNDSTELHGRPD